MPNTRRRRPRADDYVREITDRRDIGAAVSGLVLGVLLTRRSMADSRQAQDRAKALLGIGQRIVTIIVENVNRLRLAVVELEEEASLFSAFADDGRSYHALRGVWLMSLMVLVIWAIDPQYRLNAMIATTVVLLVLCAVAASGLLRKSASVHAIAPARGTNTANDRRQILEGRSVVSSKANAKASKRAASPVRSSSNGGSVRQRRRDWLGEPPARRSRLEYGVKPRSRALVGSAAAMAIWTIRHPNMLVRWAKRGTVSGGAAHGKNTTPSTTAPRLISFSFIASRHQVIARLHRVARYCTIHIVSFSNHSKFLKNLAILLTILYATFMILSSDNNDALRNRAIAHEITATAESASRRREIK